LIQINLIIICLIYKSLLKTHKGIKKSNEHTQGRKVIRYKLDNEGNEIDLKEYPSISTATRENKPKNTNVMVIEHKKTNASVIFGAIKNKGTAYGYYWRYALQPNLVGEIWQDLSTYWKTINPDKANDQNEFIGYVISNMGRLKDPNGLITKGTIASGYKSHKIRSKAYQFHMLVCTVFNGDKPSNIHTADHIDKNRTNNIYTNLRWLTPQDQSVHALGKEVNVFKDDVHIGRYQTLKEASEKLNLDAKKVSSCVTGKQNTHRGYNFQLVKK
jgi:hypothetical protein